MGPMSDDCTGKPVRPPIMMTSEVSDELRRRFSRHEPTPEGAAMCELIRAKALDLAALIERQTPPGRERANAVTAIEEAVMWANKAITTPTAPAARPLTMEPPKPAV